MFSSSDIAEAIKSKGKFWITFIGDSITSCEWVHPNWREIVEYVLWQEAPDSPTWNIKTFNFGYDGATTRDILDKIPDITSVKPNLAIVLMGGNDPLFKISVDEHVKNIREIINRLETKVVWCTSTPPANGKNKYSEYGPYAKAVMEIPQSENLKLIDMFTFYKQFPLEKFFTFISEDNPIAGLKAGDPDPDHPNILGNAYIAKVILKEVFGIDFDPEKYIKSVASGVKYPEY